MKTTRENPAFLKEQIITYLGNKRALLGFIASGVEYAKSELKKDKVSFLDMFSGSGVVSRFAKGFASFIVANDLEDYAYIISKCYLANVDKAKFQGLCELYERLKLSENELQKGFLSTLYAPKDENAITKDDRVFFTARNAAYLDTMRARIKSEIPPEFQHFFIAPLIYEASVHSNTSGVFKGFYKDSRTGLGKFGGNGGNALSRILGPIEPRLPVLSRFSCETRVLRQDAAGLPGVLPRLDLAYLDPPYNQHPYGSNYFMLNLIAENRLPDKLSPVSGIPADWNRSDYNKQARALDALGTLAAGLDARFLLISYNSEGFISLDKMEGLLSSLGRVERRDIRYNAYRASRNLAGRETYVSEYLFLVDKTG